MQRTDGLPADHQSDQWSDRDRTDDPDRDAPVTAQPMPGSTDDDVAVGRVPVEPGSVPADTGHLLAMVNALPAGSIWTSFGISRMQMPWVAQSILLGGNVRVGLEDNLFLEKGVFASNGQLVEKAIKIIQLMGARPLTPAEARKKLGLRPRN